jgi:hypothetical protein
MFSLASLTVTGTRRWSAARLVMGSTPTRDICGRSARWFSERYLRLVCSLFESLDLDCLLPDRPGFDYQYLHTMLFWIICRLFLPPLPALILCIVAHVCMLFFSAFASISTYPCIGTLHSLVTSYLGPQACKYRCCVQRAI